MKLVVASLLFGSAILLACASVRPPVLRAERPPQDCIELAAREDIPVDRCWDRPNLTYPFARDLP